MSTLPTCWTGGDPGSLQLTREQLPPARVALQRLAEREASLVAALHQATAEVDELEECEPYGVVRIDPERRVDDLRLWNVASEIQARAEARAKEWMDALGGGTVLASAAASTAAEGRHLSMESACSVRRDAWVTIVHTARRPVQVVAALLSVLPPDGTTCRMCDVSWIEPALGDERADRLGREGLQLLRSLRPVEPYSFEACAAQLATLALPVPCHVHLRAQPIMHGHAHAHAHGAELSLEVRRSGLRARA